MKILVYTSMYYIGSEKQNLPLVKELLSRGHHVIHAAPTMKFNISNNTGFPNSFKQDKDFINYKTNWINSSGQMFRLIRKCDILIIGNARFLDPLVDYARKKNKIIIQNMDKSSFDIINNEPDLYCSISEKFRDIFLSKYNYPSHNIRITGALQFDDANPDNYVGLDKDSFCNKYKLDPSKKIAIWLPSSPASQWDNRKQIYKQACEIISESGFNLLIKGHPWDYLKRKMETQYPESPNLHSWEILAPEASVCEPHDFYKAIYFCDVGVSSTSSVCIEFPLFHKPFIYVDRYESFLFPDFVTDAEFPIEKSHVPGWHKFDVHNDLIKMIEEGFKGVHPLSYTNPSYYKDPKLEFIGMDVKMDELKDVLENKKYLVTDTKLYARYIQKWCFKNDGKAYKRIADATEEYLKVNQVKNTDALTYLTDLLKIKGT